MSRGKMGVFASAAAIALIFGSTRVSADGHLIGAVDNTTPDAPASVTAMQNTTNLEDVDVTWETSGSDEAGSVSTGGFANNLGGNFVEHNDVAEYIVYVSINEGVDWDEVGTAGAGATTLSHTPGVDLAGQLLLYGVSASDGLNESAITAATLPVQLGDAPSGSTITYDGTSLTGRLAVNLPSLDPDDGDAPVILGDDDVGQDAMTVGEWIEVTWGGDGGDLTFRVDLDASSGFSAIFHGFVDELVNSSRVFRIPGDEATNGTNTIFLSPIFDAATVDNFNGTYTGAITFVTNDPGLLSNVGLDLSATVTGGVASAMVDVDKTSFNFVNVAPGAISSAQTLTVSNTGDVSATVSLDLTGDEEFDVSAASVTVAGSTSEQVSITFSPGDGAADGDEFSGLITVTSEQDPAAQISVILNGVAGAVAGEGEVSATVVEMTLTLSADVPAEAFVEGSDLNNSIKASFRSVLALRMGIDESRIIITSVIQGSTEVTFQVLDPPEDEPDAPSAADAAAALETIVADEPETLVDDLEAETGEELGTVDAVTSDPVVVVIQPQDAEGNPIAGWFTRTGTKVDFDDFFFFADAFGSSLGDPSFGTVYDISGADLEPDGQVNFDDFFKFADDFGKTVANATDVQELLGM